MSIQYTLAFDFNAVLLYMGTLDYTDSYPGYTYEFYYPFYPPTDAASYASTVTWLDDRAQPSWTDITTTGFAAYSLWYYSQPAVYQDVIDLKTAEPGLFAAVATSGSYADLTSKPTIPAAQQQSDWSASSGVTKIVNKPTFATVATSGSYSDLSSKPTLGISYEGTVQRTSSFPIFKSATVSSGVAVFNLTSDGTSTGTALFPNGVIQDSVNATVNDATAAYQMSWVFSNSNKTLTVTSNKLTTSNILTGILGQAAANSSVIKLSVWGY